jgi:hypothetical protein
MFLNSSLAPLSLAPSSGFVAFDGGGVVDADTCRVDAKVTLPVAPLVSRLPVADVAATADLFQSPTWQPAAGRLARRVEGASIIAICGYFIFGFASLAGWI